MPDWTATTYDAEGAEIAAYRLDPENRRLLVRYTGELTKATMVDLRDKMLADKSIYPSFTVMIDLAQVTNVNMSSEEIFEMAAFPEHAKNPMALLIPADQLQDLYYKMYIELLGVNHPTGNFKAFTKIGEAHQWLDDNQVLTFR